MAHASVSNRVQFNMDDDRSLFSLQCFHDIKGRMEMRFVAAGLLALSGCNAAVADIAIPERSDIEKVEERLSQHSCVGSLGEWERNYRFARKSGLFTAYSLNPDLDVVEFHLRRTGTISIRPGRFVFEPPPSGDWPDSSPIKYIDGKFTLSTGSLRLSKCEPIDAP